MAPNQNNQIFDYQPSIDQQTSLSSQKIENKVKNDFLQLYDFKMEPTSQASKGYKGNCLLRFLLIGLLLISLIILYRLGGHPSGWREKIKSRDQSGSVIGRLPRKGQFLRIQQNMVEQPKIGISNEQGRNPNKDGMGLSGQALLLTIKQPAHNLNEKQIEMPEASVYQRRSSLEEVQILPKSYRPKNPQIQTNNIPSVQLKKPIKQISPLYQVVKTSQSYIEYREKPAGVIKSDQYTPIIVQPMINPFNPQTQTSDDGFKFIGSEAGISSQMLYLARERRKIANYQLNHEDRITKQQIEYYEARYNVGKYEELPFCIVVPTFNNMAGDRFKKNIQSIIMQNYTNFHIVIIDDASTDTTGTSIKNHLLSSKFNPQKYLIKTNKEQSNAMPNLRSAALQNCRDEQIFLVVDGDDELLGRQVLKVFNAVFQEKGLWFVYSNFLMGSGELGYSRPFPKEVIRENFYRTSAFVSSHLRAFYTKLFKNIEEKDLRDQYGRYYKAANDVAICFPILQQAHTKVGYLPQMTYFYNADTGINNHFIRLDEQKANEMAVRNRRHYEPLQKLF